MPTRLSTEERQTEIVAAALRLAEAFSPARITTGEIAAAVGVSQGAVFKHFSSKEAIWLAAMGRVRTQLLQSLDAAAQAAATPLAALAAVFRAHVDFVVAHPGVPRLIFHELEQPADSAVKQEVRALLQAYRKLLLRLLDAAVRQGQASAVLDQEAAATLFVGIVQGLVMQSMLSGKPATMKAQADRVFALYLHGICEVS
ncbi:transcriptional regulator, TetR family [Leptothrix cholodnii SP-6]|uniref:Transcriptional regulator, TetR family n=1 Tax=Leptothrix cholodnii (strain ATCC 51168 / LMG 8142 / SP-6) TaxID=395495 RepID=B1Y1Q0_LEPCP|nr:TetR/AcrR family transcriptional regulator [Leptothrix cholodnii]ACB35512.1 transcriptional regulator, TetR family [Leptothrix cholodnii SP-6]